jgi:ABC-2 type transport system permease protein
MTVTAALTAERIKLQTTRSPLWSAIAAAGLSVGFAILLASAAPRGAWVMPERAVVGLAGFGVPIMMILAATTVTGEYRSGMIRTTFGAMPNRTLVLTAKAIVSAVFAGTFTAAMAVASIAVAHAVAGPDHNQYLSLAEAPAWRPVWALALYAALGAVLAVGLAAMLRHAAGVTAVLVLLPFVVEPLLCALPEVGPRVGPLLPFVNAYRFAQLPITLSFEMYWGPLGALLYFTAVVVIVFLLGVLVISRRDA